MIDEGIKHAPDLYKFGTSKMKIRNLKRPQISLKE